MSHARDDRDSSDTNHTERRVVVFGFSTPALIDLLARLAEPRNWKIVYWIGSHPELEPLVKRKFPDAQFHAKLDARANRFPDTVPRSEWPVRDADIVREVAHHDPVLYSVFLRDARARSGLEQMAEYHEAITTWYCFLDYIAADILLYDNIPAHVYDYLPYLLSRTRVNTSLLLLRPMQVPGVIIPTNRFEDPPLPIAERYRAIVSDDDSLEEELNEKWRVFHDRMTSDYQSVMYSSFAKQYSVDKNSDRLKIRGNTAEKIRDIVRRICDGRPYRFQLRSLISELRSVPRRYRLRRSYESRTAEPDYSRPYVFVPLHVQPERTSVPQGGIFGHQLLMVEYLSRALPDGWVLYVKEHPVQLHSRPASRNFRTPAFYRELDRFSNVQLVPSRVSARKLIDHARAVASATSTACWEAIFQRKPALVFGHVFFTFFEGILPVTTFKQCTDALSRIEQGYKVDAVKVRAGLLAMQHAALPMPEVFGRTADGGMEDEEIERLWRDWLARAEDQIDASGMVRSDEEKMN